MEKTETKLMTINELTGICGYFYNAYDELGSHANNGYNCKHPDCGETYTDEKTGKEIGCCYDWSCPLCYTSDYEECKKLSYDCGCYDECEKEYEENCGSCECESEMVVVNFVNGKIKAVK